MNSEALAIETRQLMRQFGDRDAVNGLSLQVRPGRCYGFFGRNGALAAGPLSPRSNAEGDGAFEGAAAAARADRRDLRRAGRADPRRTDLRTRSDCPSRVRR